MVKTCSVKGCNRPHLAMGYCNNHYSNYRVKLKRETDPEWRDKTNKYQMKKYYEQHDYRKKQKRGYSKKYQQQIVKALGSKCISCDEKYNPDLKQSNLQIHHKFYSEEEKKIKKENKGNLGATHKYEALRMIKQGKYAELKKKFTLLCQQCNTIEAFVRKNPKKAFETFCWIYSEGQFNEVLSEDDDKSLRKITEFLK